MYRSLSLSLSFSLSLSLSSVSFSSFRHGLVPSVNVICEFPRIEQTFFTVTCTCTVFLFFLVSFVSPFFPLNLYSSKFHQAFIHLHVTCAIVRASSRAAKYHNSDPLARAHARRISFCAIWTWKSQNYLSFSRFLFFLFFFCLHARSHSLAYAFILLNS